MFHWHVEDIGIRHIYITPRRPNLNGKVERSHATDEREFYQLLTYTDDVDLDRNLFQWEDFFNFNRPHGGLNGKILLMKYSGKSYNQPKTLSGEVCTITQFSQDTNGIHQAVVRGLSAKRRHRGRLPQVK